VKGIAMAAEGADEHPALVNFVEVSLSGWFFCQQARQVNVSAGSKSAGANLDCGYAHGLDLIEDFYKGQILVQGC
jgi:hypothetical protein